MENNIENVLQAIDSKVEDNERITTEEINKYLADNEDSEIGKKALKSIDKLKNKTEVVLENLKQRIAFDSLKLKPKIEIFREIIWDSADKAKVNPSVLALLINGETVGGKEGADITNPSGFMGLSQMGDRALKAISGKKGVTVEKYKSTLEGSNDSLEDRAKIQIYYGALYLNYKQSNRAKKVELFNDFDALVEYNIGGIQYLNRIDNNIVVNSKTRKITHLKDLYNNQAYAIDNETPLDTSVKAVEDNDGFKDLNASYTPKSLQKKFADNINNNVVKERIVAISNAKKYYLGKNENNKYLQEVLGYVPTGKIEVPDFIEKQFNQTYVDNAYKALKIERPQDVGSLGTLSILDVLGFGYGALNVLGAIMDGVSGNWGDAIQKLTIAYVGYKNIERQVGGNLGDFSKKIDSITERYSEKGEIKDGGKNLRRILEKIYNGGDSLKVPEKGDDKNILRVELTSNLFPNDKKDNLAYKEKIGNTFKNVNYDKLLKFNGEINSENVENVLDEKVFNGLDSDLQGKVLNLLNIIKREGVTCFDEFNGIFEYVTWNLSPNIFDKITDGLDITD